jgi:hypothetical protein
MTEAERLRAQSERCTQLAGEATDKSVIDALLGLAAESLEQASNLEQQSAQRQQIQSN